MSLTRAFAAAVAAVVLMAPLAAQTLVVQPAKAEPATETRTVPLAAGSALKVKNVNGFIHVEGWDRDEVQFTGEFKPSSRDEQVKVVIEPGKGSLEIRGEYPKHEGWGSYRGPECRMTLKVPRRIAATLETVNGQVSLAGTKGSATLKTVNGAIRAADVEESLKATTVNGAISLERVRAKLDLQTVNGAITGSGMEDRGQGMEAESVNGAIRLQIGGLKGRLTATTMNGSISFHAKGAEQVEVTKHRVTATFPGGDQEIRLSTVNGGITLD